MKSVAIILAISFLAIAGVGMFFMGGMNGHNSCLATAINGFPCPTESVAGETFFHVNAARALTALLLIAPFLLLAFFMAQAKTENTLSMFRSPTSVGSRTSRARILPQTAELIRWRALHELSPTRI